MPPAASTRILHGSTRILRDYQRPCFLPFFSPNLCPGIVTVHDICSDAEVDFIVMEYVSGKTLDQLIRAKGLGVARALRYGGGDR